MYNPIKRYREKKAWELELKLMDQHIARMREMHAVQDRISKTGKTW